MSEKGKAVKLSLWIQLYGFPGLPSRTVEQLTRKSLIFVRKCVVGRIDYDWFIPVYVAGKNFLG